MTVAISYPGVYIEELPSTTHPIVPAPTSIAVFIGYTHPFKTIHFGMPVELFTFSDYERNFGGLYRNGLVPSDVAYAVYQFFLNGGSHAWVVGLQPRYQTSVPSTKDIDPATLTLGKIIFTARELIGYSDTDPSPAMTVAITNLRGSGGNTVADIQIVYGTRVETYRGVTLDGSATSVENLLGVVGKEKSQLVTVSGVDGPPHPYGTTFTSTASPQVLALPGGDPPASLTGVMLASDFTAVFGADTPLDKLDIFNLLMLPGIFDNGILSAAEAFAEKKRAFMIMDPPANATADTSGGTPINDPSWNIPQSINAAIYFPYIRSSDPLTGAERPLPPSGTIAGIFARTDNDRGVWKAPAGLETTIKNTLGVVPGGVMTDPRQGVLNDAAINCLRTFPNLGTVVFGARTVVAANTAFAQWKYVPVRRMALFIEQTLYHALGWAVFEPNDEPLWRALRTAVGDFMTSLFRQGAFQGATPSQAFLVACDSTTTRQTDIDLGVVNILVGFRPLKPAEFVIIRITQLAGQAQS